eukprot:813426-Prorocentrum_minimum.AAC.1
MWHASSPSPEAIRGTPNADNADNADNKDDEDVEDVDEEDMRWRHPRCPRRYPKGRLGHIIISAHPPSGAGYSSYK